MPSKLRAARSLRPHKSLANKTLIHSNGDSISPPTKQSSHLHLLSTRNLLEKGDRGSPVSETGEMFSKSKMSQVRVFLVGVF